MKKTIACMFLGLFVCLMSSGHADGRGFGGFRGGSFSSYRGGGFSSGSFSGYRSGGFSGADRSFSYSGSRSGSAYSGWRGAGATSSYDRSMSGSHGGSVNVEGQRGAVMGPRGGVAAGGTRDVTATGPEGRTYSGTHQAGVAAGPYGRMVGGSSRAGVASGPRGTVAGASHTSFAASRFPTDFGLAHYSSFGAASVHSTSYWSHSYVTSRAGYVRTGFGYYHAFRPGWYTAHPGAWTAAGWAAGAAWTAATYASIASYCSIPDYPIDYDYGNTIVYQDNNVYLNGGDAGTAQTYAQQAVKIADQGQKASPPAQDDWKPLGVFALVQGEEKTSNNIFQLAVNKKGVLRGNYYDGLMDTTSPIFGSVDKETQRAAWTIGKKNDRVFEAGVYNLTQDEAPVLVHIGTDRTQQWLLVRMQQPKDSK